MFSCYKKKPTYLAISCIVREVCYLNVLLLKKKLTSSGLWKLLMTKLKSDCSRQSKMIAYLRQTHFTKPF